MSFRLTPYESLPSTSTLLTGLAAQGEPEGLAILARRQTAGRGTQGRDWESPAGNLHLSVLLRPTAPLREAPQWALLAAVALHQAAGPHTRLKWPNDLMLGGAKAGGILAETAATPDGRIDWLVLGFGVNLAHAPSLPGRATAALGPEPPEDFAARLLDALAQWHRTRLHEGFAPIRAAWMAAGPAPDSHLSILQASRRIAGRYAGLSEDGGLMLATAGRVHTLHVGEVADAAGH